VIAALPVTLAAIGVGLLAGRAPLEVPLLASAALLIFAVVFLKSEVAIHILILSMLLSPEFSVGGPVGGVSLEGSRSAVIRIEDLLLLVIGVAWLAKIGVHKQLGLVIRTPLNWAIGLYALVTGISTLIAMTSDRVTPVMGALYVGKYLEYFVVYFLVVNHARTRRSVNRMIVTAAITAVLVSLVAVAQIPSGQRVSAPFEGETGEPNTLGGYLVLMMSVFGAMALEAPKLKWRAGLGAVVALMGVALLYTLSRSSWLAAIASSLVLLVVTRQRRRLVPILAVGLLAAVFLAPERVADRVGYTFSESRESVRVGDVALDPSASARVRSWGEVASDALAHPILGHGVAGYHFIDAQYFRILAECGLLGLLAFGLLIVFLVKLAREASLLVTSPMLRGLSAGFLAAIGGLLVHAIGANTFIIVRIMEPFWLMAGLVIVAPLVERAEKGIHDPA